MRSSRPPLRLAVVLAILSLTVSVAGTRAFAQAGSQIASCISGLTNGGVCDFSTLQGAQTIGQNVFAGAKAGVTITLILGPATFAVTMNQLIPSNTTIVCRGSSFAASTPKGDTWLAPPYGIFSNSNWNTYTASGGRNTNIQIRGCSLSASGTGPGVEGIVFFGADNSIIENNSLSNIAGNGIHLRDGLSNIIENNFCSNCGSAGAPYDAFGGGIQIATFRYNKYLHNHATGGGAGIDHYDLFGQGTDVFCDNNIFDGNTSDSSAGEGVVIDTCPSTQWINNIVRGSTSDAIVFSNGTNPSETLGLSLIRGNLVTNSGGNGITVANNVYSTVIDANEIVNSAHNGIALEWTSQDSVTNNQIVNASTAGGYSGVELVGTTGGGGTQNLVSNNYIYATSSTLEYGIYINPGGDFEFNNIILNNNINIPSATTCIQNGGTSTVLSTNVCSGVLQ
jgi:parallel beta-helix repeat protein